MKIQLSGRRVRWGNYLNNLFKPGNEEGKKKKPESPEARLKRLKGLRKAWTVKSAINAGKRPMTVKKLKQKKKEDWITEEKTALQIQKRAREMVWELGIEELGRIIRDKTTPAAVKLGAITALMDRAIGKPNSLSAHVQVNTNVNPDELTSDQLQQRIDSALRRVGELKEGPKELKEINPRPKQLTDLREPDRNTGSPKKSNYH